MTPEVEHDAPARRFQARVEGGQARLDYELAGDTMAITHVEVPKPARAHGVAAALMHAALDFAGKSGLRIVPRCPYAAGYLRRHREWRGLLA
jgi:uncharacterized protein